MRQLQNKKNATGFIKVIFLFCLTFTRTAWAQPSDSRDVNIPTDEREIQNAIKEIEKLKDSENIIRLHFRVGALEKAISALYIHSLDSIEEERYKYIGVEPVSFSKPSANLIRVPIDFFGSNLADAMKDKPEAHKVMKRYKFRAVTATVLLMAGVFTSVTTIAGMTGKRYIYGNSRDEHLRYGIAGSVAFLSLWIVPKLFNRGKIHKACRIYNR